MFFVVQLSETAITNSTSLLRDTRLKIRLLNKSLFCISSALLHLIISLPEKEQTNTEVNLSDLKPLSVSENRSKLRRRVSSVVEHLVQNQQVLSSFSGPFLNSNCNRYLMVTSYPINKIWTFKSKSIQSLYYLKLDLTLTFNQGLHSSLNPDWLYQQLPYRSLSLQTKCVLGFHQYQSHFTQQSKIGLSWRLHILIMCRNQTAMPILGTNNTQRLGYIQTEQKNPIKSEYYSKCLNCNKKDELNFSQVDLIFK